MEDIKKMLIQLMEGQEELKLELRKNTQSIVNLENEIKPRVEALFDGYKQTSEQLNRIESEVSRHEEVIIRRIK